jgi:DNA/RNA-binding domain of Phe-tRNA-synthetase-like protein
MTVEVSADWKRAFPGAVVGTLVMRAIVDPSLWDQLEVRKRELEDRIRGRFAETGPADIRNMDVMQAYRAHYRRHKKSYHVQLQLESLLFKGRSLPKVMPLVDTMFMAEMKNLLLTAGHDLDVIRPPVKLEASSGDESYTCMNGSEQVLRPGDMMMADREGVISSVLYGPDRRTRITRDTRRVLFVVYAPDGVGEQAVSDHLEDIEENVLIVAPQATTESLDIHVAG